MLFRSLVVSDFDHNSGVAPLDPARRLNVPIFALGVGATHAVDVGVDLQTSLKMKKTEQSTVTVTLRQHELSGQSVTVKVSAQAIEPGGDAVDPAKQIPVGEKTVTLSGPSMLLEFPFTPQEAGRFMFIAEVDALPGETFQGTVFYIDPAETVTQGVVDYKIKVSLNSSDTRIRSGLTANLAIRTRHKDAVALLPQYAILQNDQGTYVEVMQGKNVINLPVTLGIQDEKGNVEIVSGVQKGDQVLNVGLKK